MPSSGQIIAALNDPVFELSTEGLVIYATASAEAWIGPSTDCTFADVLNIRERTRFVQALKRIVDGKVRETTLEIELPRLGDMKGSDITSELKIINGNDVFPVELKLAAITRDSGKVVSVAASLRDLSIEKSNEIAANVQGTHLLDLVEHISDACVIESQTGTVEMVNDAFCNLFDIKSAPQSLVGMTVKALFENASAVVDQRRGPAYFPMATRDASELDFPLATGAAISQLTRPVTSDNMTAGRLHLFRNKIKKESSEGKAVSATTAVQVQLIEKVARELATTVEGAGAAIHRAEQLELPGQLLENFKRVEASAQSAFGAIAGLIDFSRLESSEILLQSSEFHLRESIASLLEGFTPVAYERGINLRLRIEQDVPEHLIGDGARLTLALRNLMECGLHAAGHDADGGMGHIGNNSNSNNDNNNNADHHDELALSIAPEYVADNVIHLSFSVEHTHAKTSAGSTRRFTPSATMQLAMARQIVRALGNANGEASSKIEIRERKDATSYQFTAAFSFRHVKEARHRPKFITLTGLPILIVSADTEERKQLAELARSWRMHVREADDAAMALQFLTRMIDEDLPIPLVITANQMPVQDGFIFAFRIKHHLKLKQTAVMMLARGGKPGDAIQCRENGISAYLRHPIIPDQLNDAIAAVMGTEDDAEATQTLITRHSLREAKAGTVLLIDANREHAALAAKALRKKDYRAVVVETAQDAFAALLQDIFDVVVVDIATPGFDVSKPGALSVAAQLRAQFGSGRAIPILLADTTAAGDAIHKDNSEYDGVITKPYDKSNLAAKIGARMLIKAD